ncbi:hypothetical protein [Methanosarcina horonobensis]|nr:hypothetical protein [Methanosarcina horonobensis]
MNADHTNKQMKRIYGMAKKTSGMAKKTSSPFSLKKKGMPGRKF